MQFRTLGKTGLQISAISFGAGPVSTLMVGNDTERQRNVVATAVERGINWFDTAASYGHGQSEKNLGETLAQLQLVGRVHIATKIRLAEVDLHDIRSTIERSFEQSLRRLRVPRVTLLQLHNSITLQRGDEPTSITPEDVLNHGGVADTFDSLRAQGLVSHMGLTGIGAPASLSRVVRSGRFETIQVPYHLLNPSAGRAMSSDFPETNYGNIIADCAETQMGVLAIRVLAGGALAGQTASPHTLKTPFFPLSLFERDRRKADLIREKLGPERSLTREAIRFVLNHPQINSAIIGFGDVAQLDEALQAMESSTPAIDFDTLLPSQIGKLSS